VLVAVNLLAINLSALILFYAAGFRPADTIEVESIRKAVASRVIVIATAIAVLSLVLALVTVATYHTQSFEQETQAELQAAFAEADIEGVELVEVTVDYELVDVLLGNEPEVNVLVGIPRDFPTPPGLAQRFDDELTERLGRTSSCRSASSKRSSPSGNRRSRHSASRPSLLYRRTDGLTETREVRR